MPDRVVCQLCSWSGKSGQGLAWAAWEYTYVDGTQGLLCTRHKKQAARAGGRCRALKDLPPFEFFAPSSDEATAEFVKPVGLMAHISAQVKSAVERAVQRELQRVVVEVRFGRDGPRLVVPILEGEASDEEEAQSKRRAS